MVFSQKTPRKHENWTMDKHTSVIQIELAGITMTADEITLSKYCFLQGERALAMCRQQKSISEENSVPNTVGLVFLHTWLFRRMMQ